MEVLSRMCMEIQDEDSIYRVRTVLNQHKENHQIANLWEKVDRALVIKDM